MSKAYHPDSLAASQVQYQAGSLSRTTREYGNNRRSEALYRGRNRRFPSRRSNSLAWIEESGDCWSDTNNHTTLQDIWYLIHDGSTQVSDCHRRYCRHRRRQSPPTDHAAFLVEILSEALAMEPISEPVQERSPETETPSSVEGDSTDTSSDTKK